MEQTVCYKSTEYPDAPDFHLLVYFSDPALRDSLRDKWVTYPSTKVKDDESHYHVWTEWVDLGPVRGPAGGFHSIKTVTSEAELKDGEGYWIPPELLDPGPSGLGDAAKGWGVILDDQTNNQHYLYFYDYVAKAWQNIGSITYTDPNTIVVQEEIGQDLQPATTINTLSQGGFWFGTSTATAAPSTNNIVARFFREQINNGFKAPTWFGSEQRFVGALRDGGVLNNLEEQYILGTDTYTTSYIDSTTGQKRIEKNFCADPTQVNSYYKLTTILYPINQKKHYNIDAEGNLHLSDDDGCDDDSIDLQSKVFKLIEAYNNGTLDESFTLPATIRIDTLSYMDNGTQTDLFEKTTEVAIITVDNRNQAAVTEKITKLGT